MGWRSRTVACLVALVAWAAAANEPDFRPLGLRSPPVDFATCRAVGSADSGPSREVLTTLTIDEAGKLIENELPEGSPAWLKDLVGCAANRIAFEPEIRDGKAARSNGQIQMTVAPSPGGALNEYTIAGIGDLLSPPRLRSNTGSILERCLPPIRGANHVSRFVILVTVAPDGTVAAAEPPVGAEAWMERTADCLKERLSPYPGTRNGIPVEAKISLPILLEVDSSAGEFSRAKPPADRDQVQAAYLACYPPDQAAMGSVVFNFDVNSDGSVSRARIVRGSGNPILDKAAACILPRLKFVPSRRGDKPIKSNITWELPVRPPR